MTTFAENHFPQFSKGCCIIIEVLNVLVHETGMGQIHSGGDGMKIQITQVYKSLVYVHEG